MSALDLWQDKIFMGDGDCDVNDGGAGGLRQ